MKGPPPRIWPGLAARQAAPPTGKEPDLRAQPAPEHLRPLIDEVAAAAKAAGSTRCTSSWATGGGRSGLWIVLHPTRAEAVGAAYDVVARHAPDEPVRVQTFRSLGMRAGDIHSQGGTPPPEVGPAPEQFSGGQLTLIVLVTLFGSALVVLAREVSGTARAAMQVSGWTVNVLVIVVTVSAALGRGFTIPGIPRRGSGDAVRPLPFIGFLVVVAALLAQAIRGLS